MVLFPVRRRWVIVCALAAAYWLHAGAQDTPATYPVRGVVLNSLTHQPIARALVEAPPDATLTDHNGRFELDLQATATTQVLARRPGYVQQSAGAQTQVLVAAEMPEVTLYLTPQAVLGGHVDLSTAEPADGISILAYRSMVYKGSRIWMLAGSAQTNSEGNFRLTNLQAPGSYLLQSMPALDETGGRASVPRFGYPLTAYPEGAGTSSGNAITLRVGQQLSVRMLIARERFYPVTITVKGDNTQTNAGIQVRVRNAAGPPMDFPAQWSFEKHSLAAKLPDGHYYAQLRSQAGTKFLYGRIDFPVEGAPVNGLSVVMVPLNAVPVQVQRNFAPSQSSNGELNPEGNQNGEAPLGLNLQLIDADGAGGNTGYLRHTPGSNDQSQLEIDNLEPGRYWVNASPFEGYVCELNSGGIDLAREPLVVGPGGSTPPIQVTVRNDGGQITGTVHRQGGAAAPANGPANAAVFAVPLFASAALPQQAGTTVPGSFTLAGLAPGAYRVIALDQYIDFNQLQPEALERYKGSAPTVTVEAGGTATADVELQHMSAADGGVE